MAHVLPLMNIHRVCLVNKSRCCTTSLCLQNVFVLEWYPVSLISRLLLLASQIKAPLTTSLTSQPTLLDSSSCDFRLRLDASNQVELVKCMLLLGEMISR